MQFYTFHTSTDMTSVILSTSSPLGHITYYPFRLLLVVFIVAVFAVLNTTFWRFSSPTNTWFWCISLNDMMPMLLTFLSNYETQEISRNCKVAWFLNILSNDGRSLIISYITSLSIWKKWTVNDGRQTPSLVFLF